MSWRRLGLILRHLPPESQFKTALRDGLDIDWDALPEPDPNQHGPWTRGDMLQARTGDLLAHWLWMNSENAKSTPPPDPYPRPGVKPRKKVTPLNPAAVAYLQYLQEHHGAAPPPDWKPAV